MRSNRFFAGIVVGLATTALVFAAVFSTAHAGTWTVGGNGNWQDDANWDTSYPDAIGATANIPFSVNNETLTIGTSVTVGTLNFSGAQSGRVNGGTLIIDNTTGATLNGAMTAANKKISFGSALQLNDNLALDINQGTSTANLELGAISGTGDITITAKSVRFNSASVTTSGAVKVGAVSVTLANNFDTANGLTLTGSTIDTPNASYVFYTDLDISGTVKLKTTERANKSTDFRGKITGPGALAITPDRPSWIATLSNTTESFTTIGDTTVGTVAGGENTYAGDTSISSGFSTFAKDFYSHTRLVKDGALSTGDVTTNDIIRIYITEDDVGAASDGVEDRISDLAKVFLGKGTRSITYNGENAGYDGFIASGDPAKTLITNSSFDLEADVNETIGELHLWNTVSGSYQQVPDGVYSSGDLIALYNATPGLTLQDTTGLFDTGSPFYDNVGFWITGPGSLTVGQASQPDVIPEPSTLVIWALGLLGLAWYAWRKRK